MAWWFREELAFVVPAEISRYRQCFDIPIVSWHKRGSLLLGPRRLLFMLLLRRYLPLAADCGDSCFELTSSTLEKSFCCFGLFDIVLPLLRPLPEDTAAGLLHSNVVTCLDRSKLAGSDTCSDSASCGELMGWNLEVHDFRRIWKEHKRWVKVFVMRRLLVCMGCNAQEEVEKNRRGK